MKQQEKRLVGINVFGLALVLTINYLSANLPINGKTPGEISDQYPNLFAPAGLTFAIWGVIYLWLSVWVGYQVAALWRNNLAIRVLFSTHKIGYGFVLSCLLNSAWIFAWHYGQLLLSVLIMVLLFLQIWRINACIENGNVAAGIFERRVAFPAFGLYQGWLSVALIANVTALLVSMNWNGWGLGPQFWTILMLAIGAVLAIYLVWRKGQIFHGLAVSWAFLGIYLKRTAFMEAEPAQAVAVVALVACIALAVMAGMRWLRPVA